MRVAIIKKEVRIMKHNDKKIEKNLKNASKYNC